MKKLFALLLALVMIVGLVACGAKNEAAAPAATEAAPAAKEEAAAPAEEAKELEGELVFLDVMPSDQHTAIMEYILDDFMAKNPGVTVEYTSVPWDEAYGKVMAMAAAGTLPDVLNTNYIELIAGGYVLYLDEYWETVPYKDDVTDATLAYEGSYYQGRMFSIPDGSIHRGVYVRTDWLEEAGIDIETLRNWTWDDYFMVCEALTDVDNGRYGCAFRGGMGGFDAVIEYFQAENAMPDAYVDLANSSETYFHFDNAVELYEKWLGLYTNGWAPKESINWGFTEMVAGFTSGQCGTVIQTPEVVQICEELMEDGTWTVLPFPEPSNQDKHVMGWGPSFSYCISANTADPDLAWALLEHIASPEMNLYYNKEYGQFPNYNSALADPFFQEGTMKGYADVMMKDNLVYGQYSKYMPTWAGFTNETMKESMQKYMQGQITAEDAIAEICAWYEENWESAKEAKNIA